MDTREIAQKLVHYCREGAWERAHRELYSMDAKSIEPAANAEFAREVHGMSEIRKKGEQFDSLVEELHRIDVSEPLVVGNSIAFVLTMDVSIKGQGRMCSPELCVYEVRDGKIVTEQFFV
jgi:hypothetical protein